MAKRISEAIISDREKIWKLVGAGEQIQTLEHFRPPRVAAPPGATSAAASSLMTPGIMWDGSSPVI